MTIATFTNYMKMNQTGRCSYELDLITYYYRGTYIVEAPKFDIIKRDRELDVAMKSVVSMVQLQVSGFRVNTQNDNWWAAEIKCKVIQYLNKIGVYRFGTYTTHII